MAKIRLSIITSIAITLLTACQSGPHVTMASNDNGNKTSIEYYGKVAFTDDNTAIKSMAKHSQIQFKQNGTKILVKRNLDGITYEVNNGKKVDSLNSDQRLLIAGIIKRLHKK